MKLCASCGIYRAEWCTLHQRCADAEDVTYAKSNFEGSKLMAEDQSRLEIFETIRTMIAHVFKDRNPHFMIDWSPAGDIKILTYKNRNWIVDCFSSSYILGSIDYIKQCLDAENAAKTGPAPVDHKVDITRDAFEHEEYVKDFMTKSKISSTVQTTLQQRGSTHGDFGDNATCALQLRDVMRSMKPHWSNCTAEQRLALEEIALKIARILSGGNNEIDNWHDIQGYAKLGENACSKTS